MKDVLSREQMVELINSGYNVGEHTWHHALINNHLLGENEWVITDKHLNRGDRLDVVNREGQGFKTTVYDEVIDIIPTLTTLEILNRIAEDPKNSYFEIGIKDKTWYLFDGTKCIAKSKDALIIAFEMLKYSISKK